MSNDEGHAVVERMIEKYKSTEAYRSNPEYARGMTDAWKAIHADLLAETAEVVQVLTDLGGGVAYELAQVL